MLEHLAERLDTIGYSSDIAAAIAAFDKQLSRVLTPSAMVSCEQRENYSSAGRSIHLTAKLRYFGYRVCTCLRKPSIGPFSLIKSLI